MVKNFCYRFISALFYRHLICYFFRVHILWIRDIPLRNLYNVRNKNGIDFDFTDYPRLPHLRADEKIKYEYPEPTKYGKPKKPSAQSKTQLSRDPYATEQPTMMWPVCVLMLILFSIFYTFCRIWNGYPWEKKTQSSLFEEFNGTHFGYRAAVVAIQFVEVAKLVAATKIWRRNSR